jgi:excisionase family DNA binding protein
MWSQGGTVSQDKEISAVEAARTLGVGLDYLYSLLWTGKLAGRKVGNLWRIPASAVDQRLKAREKSCGTVGR